MDDDITVLLPTYAEAENIGKIITTIEELKVNSSILVIDDSSPDKTQEIVKSLMKQYNNITLLTRPKKSGLGTAVTDGFRAILSKPNPPPHIIVMDADFSHNPKDILKLLDSAKRGVDIVVGSRYCEGGGAEGWPLSRRIISKMANKIVHSAIKLPINDCTSGFRCYSKRCVESILPKLHSQTYEIQIETIRQACLKKYNITEIPIVFRNRKRGKSKLSINEILGFLKYIRRALSEQTSNRKCN